MFYNVKLVSEAELSLKEKKKYIEAMYPERVNYQGDKIRNQGFLYKFNNAIGFKDVVDFIDNTNTIIEAKEKSPEGYLFPAELLFENMRTSLEPKVILEFYLPKKKFNHPNPKYTFHTKDIAAKLVLFFKKVFPSLNSSFVIEEQIPNLNLVDFAIDYFAKSLEDGVNCTIEFSSKRKLEEEELMTVLETVQCLNSNKLGIAQFQCKACSKHSNGEKPYHIELVYLSEKNAEKEIEEYGEALFFLNR